MASEKSKSDPKVEVQAQVAPSVNPGSSGTSLAAGAPGIGEKLEQAMYDKLMTTSWEETISAEQFAEFQKGTEADASVWLLGPARLLLLALADRRLAVCANLLKLETTPIERIERLHARLIPASPYLVIRPAGKLDLTATPVKRYDSGVFANLNKLVGQTQFRVETGWKERYAVAYIPKGSPLGDGIVIDLSAPLERRQTRKEEEEETEEE